MALKMSIKGHHEQVYTHKFNDLEKRNQFMRRTNLQKLTLIQRIQLVGQVLNTLAQ
jgi:hypothetical protein